MSFADLSQGDRNALACTYASLILHDGGAAINAANITTLVKSAGLNVPEYYPKLWEKGLAIRSVDQIINSAGSVVVSGGAAPAAAAPAAAAKEEPKKEEKKKVEEEEEEDAGAGAGMGGLFGDDEDY
eukprot:TRINITY_DN176_c0_g4_i1.p1 TRINITY_DN176_c0_g4~~TRINITY_DN176_c0_g4_i1.p1  ORF type:complete len:127 (-),score=60.75 TRINITY_DN176_c0_g4_i1:52-432(-)